MKEKNYIIDKAPWAYSVPEMLKKMSMAPSSAKLVASGEIAKSLDESCDIEYQRYKQIIN